MPAKITTAFKKIRKLTKKIRIIQGGQGASKTYSILMILFAEAYETGRLGKPVIVTVVSNTWPQLRDGAIADMRNICKAAGFDFENNYIKSENTLTVNGSQIQFRHVDNADFHKGKGARRDYLFINEANRIKYASIEQLMTRTNTATFIDYNPDREFWVHEHYLKGDMEGVDFIILTYKDNECLAPGERAEIEKRRSNVNWWRVYGEGQLGTYSDRQIYSYEFVDEIPKDAKRIPSGMDFGLSPDPTTLVDLYVKDQYLYCDEIFTENNLMPEKIAGAERMSIVDKMQQIDYPKGRLIIADSANATSIRDLQKHGYNVIPVNKYRGAIVDGIATIKSYYLCLTKRSATIKKGIESWFFKIDDNGKIVPEPDGHEPDTLAAIRYAMLYHKELKTQVTENINYRRTRI